MGIVTGTILGCLAFWCPIQKIRCQGIAMNEDSVLLRAYPSRQEAEIAQQMLISADIPTRMTDDDAGGWAPHVGFAAGFILYVLQSDLECARALINVDDSSESVPPAAS